jgi:hypothetical protein
MPFTISPDHLFHQRFCPSLHLHYKNFFATMASADFCFVFNALALAHTAASVKKQISYGKLIVPPI